MKKTEVQLQSKLESVTQTAAAKEAELQAMREKNSKITKEKEAIMGKLGDQIQG